MKTDTYQPLEENQAFSTDGIMKENSDSENIMIPGPRDNKISLISSTLLLAGAIIGTGIFMSPNEIVKSFPSIFYSLMIWVVCGIISLLAALCYAEMGSKFPSLGGEYTYFREVYHEMISFTYLFTNFLLIKPVCIAMLVIFFSNTILSIFYTQADQMVALVKLMSSLTIILICILNCLSEKWTIRVNDILTYLKFVAMGIVICIAIYKLSKGETENLKDPGFNITISATNVSRGLYSGMWAYDGFNFLGYIVDKMYKPKTNLVIASIMGMFIIILFYSMINLSYLTILGVDNLIKSTDVALSCVKPYFKNFSFIMAILVGLSALATASSTSYSGGNLYFDGGQNGHFPSILAAYHIRLKTYVPALVVQTLIVILFILIAPDINILLVYFSGASWVYYSLTFLGVIVARYHPNIKNNTKKINNFELWIGIPIFTFIVSVGIVIMGFFDDWVSATVSMSIIVCSIPAYFILVYKGGVFSKDIKAYIERITQRMFHIFSLTDQKE